MRLSLPGAILLSTCSTWSTPVFAQAIADRASLAPILSHLDSLGGAGDLVACQFSTLIWSAVLTSGIILCEKGD